MTTYRVRLLDRPIILYHGVSYVLASNAMDAEMLRARIMEHLARDGWRTVIRIVPGRVA